MKQLFQHLACMMLALTLQSCAVFNTPEEVRTEVLTVAEPIPVLKLKPVEPFKLEVVNIERIDPLPVIVKAHISQKEIACAAQAAYFEARGEGDKGMAAVVHVVQNRMNDARFPSTACGVVNQKAKRKTGKPTCEFHYTCDGIPDVIRDKKTFTKAMEIAKSVLQGESRNFVGKSLFFHHVSVAPQKRKYAARFLIGRHVFYTSSRSRTHFINKECHES